MLSCEPYQNLMVDALYLDDTEELPSRLATHLESCESCRKEFNELKQARELLDTAGFKHEAYDDIPERASLDGMYDKLSSDLDRIDAQRFREQSHRGIAPWSVALGAIAASLVIFVTGFVFLSSNQTTPEQVVSTELVSPDLMNYLDRAQVMLMQVANAETENGSVLPIQSGIARTMALEANVLTGADRSPFTSGEKKLLQDIEFMLLQIANLDESNMQEGVALLQQFLDDNGILFRIRLLELRDQELVI